MRNLTICDIRLHPSTVESTFEEAMVGDIMANAGDQSHPPGTLFVRGLYRATGDTFPVTYRCLVSTTLASDDGFFGMHGPIQDLGADVTELRSRLFAGALPNDEAALASLELMLVMVTINVAYHISEGGFEKALVAALEDEVGVATRVNNVRAAFWTRDHYRAATQYLVAAAGTFMRPQLRGDTVEHIRTAGGEVVTSLAFGHVGTVFDDEHRPSAAKG